MSFPSLPPCGKDAFSVALHAVLGDQGVDQRGLLGLFRTIDQTAAVLRSSGFKLICRTVEGGQAFALVHIVAALFVQGDAGCKVQRVSLLLAASAQQRTLAEPIFSASLATM